MSSPKDTNPYRTVGSYLASTLGGTWHPVTDPWNERDLSGYLQVDGLWLSLGMDQCPDHPGPDEARWLQIATMAIVTGPEDVQDPGACGKGLGTKVVKALQDWVQEHQTTLRLVSIENAAFFSRFSWAESDFDDPHDGQCWYY